MGKVQKKTYIMWDALIDLRCYCHCVRDDIGQYEMYQSGIDILLDKGLIVPVAPQDYLNEKGNPDGLKRVRLTDRFRKLGQYLRLRKWGRPQETST
jgi:hypothetical protein